jgi:hypothetical protein
VENILQHGGAVTQGINNLTKRRRHGDDSIVKVTINNTPPHSPQ